jgi:hypothetical protein
LSCLRFNLDADLVKTSLALKFFARYFAVLFIIIASCDSEEYKRPDIGLDYFPLQTGFYQIYDVETIEYTRGSSPVTGTFEMLVQVVDSFPSTANEITYVIHRSARSIPDADWTVLDTWSARKNDREVVVNEGNVPYLKLIFPVQKGSKWNPNKYNTGGIDEIEITAHKVPFQLEGGTTFDNTLTVLHDNEDHILYLDKRQEVYAEGSGLIYKETVQLHYCEEDNCRGQEIVDNGFEYRQWLKMYGVD